MPDKVIIAVDAMGGDDAPGVVLEGVRGRAGGRSRPARGAVRARRRSSARSRAAHERCTAQRRRRGHRHGRSTRPMPCARKKDSSIVVGCRLVKEGARTELLLRRLHRRLPGGRRRSSWAACKRRAAPCAGHGHPVARAPRGPAPTSARTPTASPRTSCSSPRWPPCTREKVVGVDEPARGACSTSARRTRRARRSPRRRTRCCASGVPNFAGNARGLRHPAGQVRRHRDRRLHGQRVPEDHRGHRRRPCSRRSRASCMIHPAHEAGRAAPSRAGLKRLMDAGEPRHATAARRFWA